MNNLEKNKYRSRLLETKIRMYKELQQINKLIGMEPSEIKKRQK